MKKLRQYVAMAAALMIISVAPANITYADEITDSANGEKFSITGDDKEELSRRLEEITTGIREDEVVEDTVENYTNQHEDSDDVEDLEIADEGIATIDNQSSVTITGSNITRNSMELLWNDTDYSNSNYTVMVYATKSTSPSYGTDSKVLTVSNTNSVELTDLVSGMTYKIVLYKNGQVIAENTVTTLPDFVVFVGESLYKDSSLKSALDTYVQDLRYNEGLGAEIVRVSKTEGDISGSDGIYKLVSPQEVKDVVRNRYADGNGAQGFVIIGSGEDIPTAVIESTKEDSSEKWPSDLYFADMDGSWKDTDSDGMFEDSEADDQRYTPELYFGRINSNGLATTTEEQVNYITEYLDRVHNYRTIGDNLSSAAKGKALSFNDANFDNFIDPMPAYSKIFKNIRFMRDPNETSYDNLKDAFNEGYEVINLDIHSNYMLHQIHLSDDEQDTYKDYYIGDFVKDLVPGAPKFNLMDMYCCSGCKFENRGVAVNNLGAYYLFTSNTGLNIAGSTGTFGPWLDNNFYDKFSSNYSVGESFKNFLINQDVLEESQSKAILLGDPTIKYRVNKLDNATPYVITDLSGDIDIYKTSEFVYAKSGEEFAITAYDNDSNDQVYFDFGKTLPQDTTTRQDGRTIYLTFPDKSTSKNNEYKITMNVFNKNADGEKINNYKESFTVKVDQPFEYRATMAIHDKNGSLGYKGDPWRYVVYYENPSKDNYITYNKVTVDEEGKYDVKVNYVEGAGQNAFIGLLGDGYKQYINFFADSTQQTAKLWLKKGENSINISANTDAGLPPMESLYVKKAEY